MTRRDFMGISGGMLAGAGLWFGFAQTSQAAEGKPWTAAVRDTHLREVGEKDAWSAAHAIGAEGVEVDVTADMVCGALFVGKGKPYSIADDAEIKRLAGDAKANAIAITAFCMHNQFDTDPAKEIAAVARVARACRAMGVPAIRLDVVPRKTKDPDEFLTFATQTCKRFIADTADTAVKFGIENHGGTTNRVEFLEKLFAAVGSDRLGLTLDTGNFYWFGYPLSRLYEIYEQFAPRVFHTHVKSIKYPADKQNVQREMGWEYGKYNCPITEGDIDFKRVVAILRKAGYAGDLCIEDESLDKFDAAKRRDVLAKEVAFLKQIRTNAEARP
jgi:sugar phosphate isomerase/epimerase